MKNCTRRIDFLSEKGKFLDKFVCLLICFSFISQYHLKAINLCEIDLSKIIELRSVDLIRLKERILKCDLLESTIIRFLKNILLINNLHSFPNSYFNFYSMYFSALKVYFTSHINECRDDEWLFFLMLYDLLIGKPLKVEPVIEKKGKILLSDFKQLSSIDLNETHIKNKLGEKQKEWYTLY